MAGGLSAGSVRDTRRPRRVLPGGVTSLGCAAALPPGPGAPEKSAAAGQGEASPRRSPAASSPGRTSQAGKVKLGAQLPRSTSGAKMAPAPRPSKRRDAQAPSPSRRPIRRCGANVTSRQRRGRSLLGEWRGSGKFGCA